MSDYISIEVFEEYNNSKDHCRCTDNRGTNKHRFCRCFKGVTGSVGFFKIIFSIFKIRFKTEVFLYLVLDVGNGFNTGKLID